MKYKSTLTMKETQKAIKVVKDTFEKIFSETFNLDRVSAPIIVSSKGNINDDLGIVNSALRFNPKTLNQEVEIVQSLAKWKRMALKKYGYLEHEGLYTDMNAIRPLDIIDNTHSLYVDQWDWELVINEGNRNSCFLENTVRKIVKALSLTKKITKTKFPTLKEDLKEDVFFIDSNELAKKYPKLSPEEREEKITKKYKTVFIKKIGITFEDGTKHDLRAPDYDDWQLNGDLLIWSNKLNRSIELSSMGIRVNKDSLLSQMEDAGREIDDSLYYVEIINNNLPLTIGGGIGQSRMCMVLLEKLHIAEVQASMWDDETYKYFEENNINYL